MLFHDRLETRGIWHCSPVDLTVFARLPRIQLLGGTDCRASENTRIGGE